MAGQEQPRQAPGFDQLDPFNLRKAQSCIHCGLCLEHCPTYRETGNEAASPRGRIYLMRAVAGGRMGMTQAFVDQMYLCLDCRACESACPSGVPYGQLVEAARGQIERNRRRPWWQSRLRQLVYAQLLPSPALLALAFWPARFYLALARRWPVERLLPSRLRALSELLPREIGAPFWPAHYQQVPAQGQARRRLAFFSGCVMSFALPDVHRVTLQVLARAGCAVETPPEQTCCGALAVHAGERGIARALARRNIAVFEKLGVDQVVVNSAGCGAMLKEYGELLARDHQYAERAHRFAHQVKDVSEVLFELPRPPMRPLPVKVAYDEPCHLQHGQRISAQPKQLLQEVPGLELVKLPGADRCCGSAGIYNLTQPAMSQRLLAQKVQAVQDSGAQVVATGNPGCILQIRRGLRQAGSPIPVVHPVELLDQAQRGT
ncbi:MAG: 4Fe-4S dicluster domain-containing protein [Deinococcus sp.]|nr:4Fe-4S dicluster domain-containing protein [Deinococcus sp.]